MESLIAGDVLFNDFIYLLIEKRWTPIFKLDEFENYSFPFHEQTPSIPDWHPPPPPKISFVSRSQREESFSRPQRSEDSSYIQFDLLMEKLSSLESKITFGNYDIYSETEKLKKELDKNSEYDQSKLLILEKRMNWVDDKLSSYTDRRSLSESIEKEKSFILKQQIKHNENKAQEVESRYHILEKNYHNAIKEINLQERELSRLASVEKELILAQEKAQFFLEELSEVKYKMKQRESLHQDNFIKETFEKLFLKVDKEITNKIDQSEKLSTKASAGVEGLHQLILDFKEEQINKDIKFDSIIDKISIHSHAISEHLKGREKSDKRIVEKVVEGVTRLSKEQKDLSSKMQIVFDEFTDIQKTSNIVNGEDIVDHSFKPIKKSFKDLFIEIEEKISTKIDQTSKLNVQAFNSVEDFHQAVIDFKESQISKDEKFDSIVDLISKQSKVVSGLLERREALDKRIVEKVEDGVTDLADEQRDLARKIQIVVEDFKDLERALTFSHGEDSNKTHNDVIKKWQNHSSALEQEIQVLKDKLFSEMAKSVSSDESKVDYEKFLMDKMNSEKKIVSLTKDFNSQEEKIVKLVSQNTKLKSKLKKVSGAYDILLEKYNKVDSSTANADEINVQFKEEQEKTKHLKIDLHNLKSELEKLDNDYQNLQNEKSAVDEEHTKAHILIKELEVYKNAAKEQAKKEFKRLIGDSFEVSNDEIWWLKNGDIITGPHRFGELHEMKEKGEIDRDKAHLKNNEQGKWIPMSKLTEFNIPVQIHTIEEDEQAVTKYFIKRGSFRAPFYEIVTLELGDSEYRGYCTSLSQGGIFIEFNKIDPDDMYKEAIGTVFFNKGALKRSFNCKVKIMNITVKRPRGLGIMFINLDESDKGLIQDYVNQFMDQSKNKQVA